MKIKIYQLNNERDTKGCRFLSLHMLNNLGLKIMPENYDMVFEGDVKCKNLEEVFTMFNFDYTEEYCGRALSVSDVVEIVENNDEYKPGYYYCDSYGFEKINLDFSTVSQIRSKQIKILIVRPYKSPVVAYIETNLKSYRNIVEGPIEFLYPFDDNVIMVCNEEGKISGMDLNRAIYNEDGDLVEVIAGTFFICGDSEEDFESLTDEQITKYTDLYKYPEYIYSQDGKIIVKKMKER